MKRERSGRPSKSSIRIHVSTMTVEDVECVRSCSRRDLGKKAAVNYSSISRWLSGALMLSREQVKRLVKTAKEMCDGKAKESGN